MQWNNIRANFSDSNQLMGIAANQVNQGVTTATDTLTTTAELFRQAEQDKLAELERRHRMLIADKTLELENEKLAETERVNNSTIDLNNANVNQIKHKIVNDDDKTAAELKVKDAEANAKNAQAGELNALSRLYSAQTSNVNASINIANEKWELNKGLLEEQKKDKVSNRELKIQKQQYDKLKSNGSPAWVIKKDGETTIMEMVSGKVWYNGEMMDEDRYKTLVNVNNAKKITEANEAVYKIINKYLGTDPEKFDKVVKNNDSFFSKGLEGDNYYINSRTYKSVIGTLTSKFKGDTQGIKRMVDNGLIYDPNTGGVGVPKRYVTKKGNFVSTIHRDAFLVEAYMKARGGDLKDSTTKYIYLNDGLNALGIKNTSERKSILNILNKRPGG